MQSEPLEVLEVIKAWQQNPKRIESQIQKRLEPGVRLPPQITWTLLALLHYRQRKRWAWSVLIQRLPAAVAAQNENKMVSIRDVLDDRSTGILPGLPEWSYELDGNASFVANRVNGEELHVDVLNGPDVTNSDYFRQYLVDHHDPGWAEQRLLELFPCGRGITLALNWLRDNRLFHVVDQSEVDLLEFELCGIVDPFDEPVQAFLSGWDDKARRPRLAALLGDWEVVQNSTETISDANSARIVANAQTARRRWSSLLRGKAGDGLYDDLLYALAAAKPDDLPKYLSQALDDPFIAGTAVEIVGDDPTWRPKIEEIFQRSLHDKDFCYAKGAAAFALARSGASVKPLLDGLRTKPVKSHAAMLLALEYGPQHLLPILRHNLRSRFSRDRLTAAAILALLDTQRSRQELLAVLNESTEQDATIECRMALQESTEHNARAATDGWEAAHPDFEGRQRGITDRYLYGIDGGCDRGLRREMFALRELVDRARKFPRLLQE